MAKKKVNRKKVLKREWAKLKKASREQLEKVVDVAETVVDKAVEQVKEVVADIKHQAATNLEEFQALPELEGIPVSRLETFYQAGIKSVADFAAWTEKDLLGLKGIGAATIKQLKEKGIALKG
ncbi:MULTISPECIES: helix-hairpin-helix domain-containing protein [unclassified Streptococcus]|uniref:helix-hairpin-helix domain-containing protein n=1 Tax=unclassified Streptococcus TaxID=2608887 RepID=UPI001072AE0C|nr:MULTISPECIES: helix-hairpin-helix domain-containing protein [unclassified Streptococcus]MBF0787350.1 helix-hairpin-helix domain-containing protein [Streptococcus sp. 19428wC2_LYSM12]MCQ9211112.1 helix-hairpin-helix domain-containing protein [Streptococcus sp. B01]MCQ9214387.1 helix-hairpin-helix domain-containing protein [Streptococcus sp. O1]TFV05696.1 helix-hairpin-helix domain-containing protein [Streptococcus sp. LYSM12]